MLISMLDNRKIVQTEKIGKDRAKWKINAI
jgi:hypothetical protein